MNFYSYCFSINLWHSFHINDLVSFIMAANHQCLVGYSAQTEKSIFHGGPSVATTHTHCQRGQRRELETHGIEVINLKSSHARTERR